MIGSDVVDILHHQVPDRHLGIDRGAFQQLGDQHLWCVDALVGELTHLVDFIRADDGVLVGDGQGLVGVEADVQGDEAQFGVNRVFGVAQTAGVFHFLEVAA